MVDCRYLAMFKILSKTLFATAWLLVLSVLWSSKAQAATITVTTTDDTSGSQCTLRDAITSTNDNTDTGACVATGLPYGSDTINIPAGTFLLESPLANLSDSGNSVSIVGSGRDTTIIDGNSRQYQCLYVDNVVDGSVSNLTSKSCNGAGVRFNNTGLKFANDIIVTDNSGEGVTSLNLTGDTTFTNIIAFNNEAEGLSILSGQAGTVNTVSNVVSFGNSHWGMGFETDGNTTISKAAIFNNSGAIGLILTGNGNYTVKNITVAENTTENIGGVLVGGISQATHAEITNSTIANNSSSAHIVEADGIVIFDGSEAVLKNVLLANNGVGNCGGALVGVTLIQSISEGYNLSSDNTCTSFTQLGDMNNTDPKIGSLASDSGTYIIPLLSDSPAVDAGSTVLGVATDQRGVARPKGNAYDIGAYESPYSRVSSEVDPPDTGYGKPQTTKHYIIFMIAGLIGLVGSWLIRRILTSEQ